MLGFEKISNFTHELENMLDHLRLGRMELTDRIVDLLFQAIDLLTRMLAEIKTDSNEKIDGSQMVRRIQQMMTTAPVEQQANTFPTQSREQTIRSFPI